MIFVKYDKRNGKIIGFYDDEFNKKIPKNALEITSEQRTEILNNPEIWRINDGVISKNLKDELIVLQSEKVTDIISEATSRINAILPERKTKAQLDMLILLWPMLDVTKATSELILVHDIYQYAMDKKEELKIASKKQLEDYNPVADVNWPI